MSKTPVQIHRVAGGDIVLWIDDGQSIHMKLRGSNLDPVELNEDEAESFAQTLMLLAQQLRSS